MLTRTNAGQAEFRGIACRWRAKRMRNVRAHRGHDRDLWREPAYLNTLQLCLDQAIPPSAVIFLTDREAIRGDATRRQELNAEILDDVQGALWSRDMIEAIRKVPGLPIECERIVVAIDPAVSVGDDSDETGIIVAGRGWDGHGYMLEDLSGKYLPTEWAAKAIAAYRQYRADRIVAEANQGGDMIESTLRVIDPNVIADGGGKRGKLLRAEPVSALYEQRRVHHVGASTRLRINSARSRRA
jgi:phage terminase large subunit-like protein